MKKILLLLCLTTYSFIFGQEEEKSIYFPQEQIIHPNCSDSIDKNDCLSKEVEQKLIHILKKEKTKRLFYNDTLKVSITFVVDKKGKIFEDFIKADYFDEIITQRLTEETSYYIKQLPIFKVKNRKPRPYNSFHEFEYQYLINYKNDKSLTKIANTSKYTGGHILEVPLFPGCKRINGWKDRTCFNEKMQKHISQNFKYPEKAQNEGIQGRVNTMMVIKNDGTVGSFKINGPHQILEEEAARILSLLPKMTPGKRNGKPVRVPFSMPITFKLQ